MREALYFKNISFSTFSEFSLARCPVMTCHIRPGPDMATGYENLAGFRPGPDMISAATLVSSHKEVVIIVYSFNKHWQTQRIRKIIRL